MLLEHPPRESTAHTPSYAASFSPGLTDPKRRTPPIVAGPNGKAVDRRYNVYRNNVTVSLIDALAAIYPAVLRITGVDFFRAMARFHVREMPPASPLLFEYGREFAQFIERYKHAQAMPWLADVARIERAWLDAYHAADAEPLAADALASVPPERLEAVTFTAHPATRIVCSPYAAVTIFAAHRGTDAVGEINAAEPEDALITRPACDVVVRRLRPGAAVFLLALVAGRVLGEAASEALSAEPDFDIAAGILTIVESGAFASLSVGDVP